MLPMLGLSGTADLNPVLSLAQTGREIIRKRAKLTRR
jgi:hypothetical protein